VIFQSELPAHQSYVRVIMAQLLCLKLLIGDEWYVIFSDVITLNLEDTARKDISHLSAEILAVSLSGV
jgi:hypothetical protein